MKTYGIALGGGGTRGSYELGVWKYLIDNKISYDCITGTSIGAINGAFMAQGDYKTARDAWFNMGLHRMLETSEEEISRTREKGTPFKGLIKDMPALVQSAIENGGLDLEPVRKMLRETVSEEAVRSSGIELGIITVNLSTLKPVIAYLDNIPQGQLYDYILASCSLPIFKPTMINNQAHIDGAFYDNVPVKPLAEKGYTSIIGVELSSFLARDSIEKINTPFIHIKNSEDLGPVFEFGRDRVRKNMRLGYLDSSRAFGNCQGKTYFIKKEPPSKLMREFSEEELAYFIDLLNRPGFLVWDGRRALRNLRKVLDKNIDEAVFLLHSRQKGRFLAGLEIAADILEVKRLRFYTVDQLINAVLEKYEKYLKNNPVTETTDIFNTLKQKLASPDTSKLTLHAVLPEIIEKAHLPNRGMLFNFLAFSMPRFCITALLILLLKQRMNQSQYSDSQ